MDQLNSFPILNAQFFQDHPVPIELYRAWQEAHPWNEKIIPVYQWKNLLYIAVSETPLRIPTIQGMEAKLVLTTSEAIKSVWQRFQQQVNSSIQDLVIEKFELQDSPPENDLQSLDLNSSSNAIENNSPEGLDLNLEINSNLENNSNLELELNPNALTPNENDFLNLTPNSMNPLPTPISNNSLDTPSMNANPENEEKTDPNIQALPSEFAETEFFQKIFEQLSYHFTKSMVLIVDNPRTTGVRPWKWDSQFHINTGSPQNYALDVPSPFRIVFRTQKPYHGFVVSNDINDKFFESWNDNSTPDHLTLFPIIINDDVKAMILSLGEKSADNKSSLNLTAKMANEISSFFEKHPESLNAFKNNSSLGNKGPSSSSAA